MNNNNKKSYFKIELTFLKEVMLITQGNLIKCYICHHWYFCYVSTICMQWLFYAIDDLLMTSMNLHEIGILKIKNADDHCFY